MNKKGFSLTELMVSSAITITLVVVVIMTFISSLQNIETARELSIAIDDAKDTLEKIKSVDYALLINEFPDGAGIDPDAIGGFTLRDESIIVTYPNGTNANPLEIQVEISWQNKSGAAQSQIFKVLRTRML